MSTKPPNQSVKLTKTVVEKCPLPATGQAFLRDSQLAGFALRVTAKGTRAFIVEKRINARVRRITLGRFGELNRCKPSQSIKSIFDLLWTKRSLFKRNPFNIDIVQAAIGPHTPIEWQL